MLTTIPSVENILAQSFVLQGQFFLQNPTCFLMQLPRFGKEKVFPGIYLPTEIDISSISLVSEQFCSICEEEKAAVRCKNCSISKTDKLFGGDENAKKEFTIAHFCEDCFKQTHRGSRKNHATDPVPNTGSSEMTSLNGAKYELDAVICIQTSHYVSFVRTTMDSPDGKPTWLFFDSMADRQEDVISRVANNVPEVRECPTLEQHLRNLHARNEFQRYEYLQRYARQEEMLKRLVQDAYIGVYKQKQDVKETEI